MAVTIDNLVRSFNYNGMALQDPGQNLSVEEVRDIFSIQFPQIISAAIEGPERKGNKMVYTIRKAVGSKG